MRSQLTLLADSCKIQRKLTWKLLEELRYIKGIAKLGLTYNKGGECRVRRYSDADYTRDHNTCISTSGWEEYHGVIKGNQLYHSQLLKQCTV